jgi:hypothetical protein
MGSLEQSPGPGIEYPSTRALVLQQWRTIFSMDQKPGDWVMISGTANTLGMKQFDRERIALVFVHQIANWKKTHRISPIHTAMVERISMAITKIKA